MQCTKAHLPLPIILRSSSFHLSSTSNLLLGSLGHGVEGTAVLEPLNLGLVEGVLELNLVVLAILGVDDHGDGLADSELGAEDVNL